MNANEFTPGLRVRYVPGHAFASVTDALSAAEALGKAAEHPDCEDGFVSSNNAINVFVKFDKQIFKFGWDGTTSQSCSPEDLVVI